MKAKIFLVSIAQQYPFGSTGRSFTAELAKASSDSAVLSDNQQEVVIAAINCTLSYTNRDLLPLQVLSIAQYINGCK
jgi:hypothetical protein